MRKLRAISGYSLLELLLSTGIFMMSMTLVLLGITIYLRSIHDHMQDSSTEVESIRLLHQFSKDVIENNLYDDALCMVAFCQDETCPLIQSSGTQFDSTTGILHKTEIEYQFLDENVIRVEKPSSGDREISTQRFRLPKIESEELCLIISYADGHQKMISVGDVTSFQWSEDVDQVVAELGPHTRTLKLSEFVD